MKTRTTISLITAAALALTSFSAIAQGRQQGGPKHEPQDRAQVEYVPWAPSRGRAERSMHRSVLSSGQRASKVRGVSRCLRTAQHASTWRRIAILPYPPPGIAVRAPPTSARSQTLRKFGT